LQQPNLLLRPLALDDLCPQLPVGPPKRLRAFTHSQLERFVQRPQLRIHPLALRNIARDGVDALALRHRPGVPQKPSVGAVLAQVPVLELDDVSAFGHLCRVGSGRRFAVVRVKELLESPRQQILNTEAKRRFPGGVNELEVSIEAGDAEHVD